MTSLTQRVGSRAAAEIEKFKTAARNFGEAYSRLEASRPPMVVAPDIMADWERAYQRAGYLRNVVSQVTSSIDAAVGAVWRATGFDVAGLAGMSGLGAPILIPLALVAGGTAALVAGTRQINATVERLSTYNRLVNAGVPPERAAQQARGSTFIEQLGSNIVWPIAIVAGLFFFTQRR